MKKIILLCILSNIFIIHAGIVRVESFNQDFQDYYGVKYPVEKEDFERCALIRIDHNHPGNIYLNEFVSKIYKRDKVSTNRTYFYISHKVKCIEIQAESIDDAGNLDTYKPIKYNILEEMKPEKVYELVLKSYPDTNRTKKLVEIKTIPSEAEIWIDDLRQLGRTPYRDYLETGNHDLHIEREEYFAKDAVFRVKQPTESYENVFEYQLEPRFGELSIITIEGATVYLNGDLELSREGIHLDPGTFHVHVSKEYYEDMEYTGEIEIGTDFPLKMPLEPINGFVSMEVIPDDAEVRLIHEYGEETNVLGMLYKKELLMGKYKYEVYKEGYFTKRDSFFLSEGELEKLEVELKSSSIYFTLSIPEYFAEDISVHAYKIEKRKRGEEIDIEQDGENYVTGVFGRYELVLRHNDEDIFSKEIEVSEESLPVIDLQFRKYFNPSDRCKLYVDGKFRDRGKETILVTENKSAKVKVKIPRYLNMRHRVEFPVEESEYTLQLGRDYYKFGFGIGFGQDLTKKFLGLKLPVIYSSKYYKMTGIEINVFSAGNYKGLEGSGTFTGIAAAGVCALGGRDLSGLSFGGIWTNAERDLNGISMGGIYTRGYRNVNGISLGGLFVEAGNNLNGIALALGVVNCKHNLNGIALGGLIIGADNSFNGIGVSGFLKKSKKCTGFVVSPINITNGRMGGVQLGLINYAEELHGIQLGVMNIVSDGVGGAAPFLPIINLCF